MINKKGLSDVITTVLIILLTLAAIILIWTFLQPTIQKGVQNVPAQGACLQLQIDPVSCKFIPGTDKGLVNVTYKYTSGDIDSDMSLDKIKLIMTYSDGSAATNDSTAIPSKFGSTGFNNAGRALTGTTSTVFSLAPVLTVGGKDYTCGESTTKITCS